MKNQEIKIQTLNRSENKAQKVQPRIPRTLKGRDHRHVSSNIYLFVRVQHSLSLLVEKQYTIADDHYCMNIFKRKCENC